MARPEAKLQNNPYQSPTFYWPQDLGNQGSEPYCIFDIRESVARGGTSLGTIALPYPNEFRYGYNTNWETTDFGVWGFDPKFPKSTSELYDTVTSVGDISLGDIQNAGEDIMSASSSRYQRNSGHLPNPHTAAIFKGVGFRKFNFNYELCARNEKESDLINNIIYTFKYHMHPSIPEENRNRRQYYPENFVIGLFSPSDIYLYKISVCALESCEVDPNAAGIAAFFKRTGAPVKYRLQLSFTEQEFMTKERIKEGY